MEVLAACHVHSTWSYDGSWSIRDLSARFAVRGYRVLMITEHDRGFSEARFQELREACADASSSQILVVPGIEYSDAKNRVHVLVWGLDFFLGENLATMEMLEAATAANGLSVLAHPSRGNAWSLVEPRWTELLWGIEVWNRKYDGWAPSATAPALLDSTRHVAIAGLDFHTDRQSFPLALSLDLEAEITETSVLQSMRARRCRALAFGQPLDSSALRASHPALRFVERGRRMAAAAVRSARSRVRA